MTKTTEIAQNSSESLCQIQDKMSQNSSSSGQAPEPRVNLDNTGGGRYNRVIAYVGSDLEGVAPQSSVFAVIDLKDVIHGIDVTNYGITREIVTTKYGYRIVKLYASFNGGTSFSGILLFCRVRKEVTKNRAFKITEYLNKKLRQVPLSGRDIAAQSWISQDRLRIYPAKRYKRRSSQLVSYSRDHRPGVAEPPSKKPAVDKEEESDQDETLEANMAASDTAAPLTCVNDPRFENNEPDVIEMICATLVPHGFEIDDFSAESE